MTDKIVVLVTARNPSEAKRIARAVIEARLAACVNIHPVIQSIYMWEGKQHSEKETMLLIKSSRPLFGELQQVILRVHSYSTPEILCLPVIDGSPDYMRWLESNLGKPSQPEEA